MSRVRVRVRVRARVRVRVRVRLLFGVWVWILRCTYMDLYTTPITPIWTTYMDVNLTCI